METIEHITYLINYYVETVAAIGPVTKAEHEYVMNRMRDSGILTQEEILLYLEHKFGEQA